MAAAAHMRPGPKLLQNWGGMRFLMKVMKAEKIVALPCTATLVLPPHPRPREEFGREEFGEGSGDLLYILEVTKLTVNKLCIYKVINYTL